MPVWKYFDKSILSGLELGVAFKRVLGDAFGEVDRAPQVAEHLVAQQKLSVLRSHATIY